MSHVDPPRAGVELHEVAGRSVIGVRILLGRPQSGDDRAAAFASRVVEVPVQRAAGGEAAPDDVLGGTGLFAPQHDRPTLAFDSRVGDRDRRQQGPCVGVQRPGEGAFGRPLFDDRPEIHHRDPVRQLAHHRQVVRDDEVGDVTVGLQPPDEVDDVGLHGDVQRGQRFVEDDQFRIGGQGPGDGQSLFLPARERGREPVGVDGVEAHPKHEIGDGALGLGLRVAERSEWFGDDVEGGEARIESVRGVLEDDRHLLAQRSCGTRADRCRVDAADADHAGRLGEVHDLEQGRGLPASRFADDRQRLTASYIEGDAVDRADRTDAAPKQAAGERKDLDHPFDLENCC